MPISLDPNVVVGGMVDSVFEQPASLAAEICRPCMLWVWYYAFIHILYYGVGSAGRAFIQGERNVPTARADLPRHPEIWPARAVTKPGAPTIRLVRQQDITVPI